MPKGEKRAGGRPKKIRNYSEEVKQKYLKAAEKIEKETGMTIEEHFLRAAIDQDMHPGSRAAFAKLYNEALLIKETKQTIEEKKTPKVYLPEVLSKPREAMNEEEQRVH
jgi:hypothetical protein